MEDCDERKVRAAGDGPIRSRAPYFLFGFVRFFF
jgi:hypothetical protein